MVTKKQAGSLAEVKMGLQGRVVIPAWMRKELEIGVGDELVAHVEGASVVLEKRENVINRVRGRFATVPEGVRLVDELISERREEARKEGSS